MYNVIKKLPCDWCDVEDENEGQDQGELVLHDEHLGAEMEYKDNEAIWSRDDVPTKQVLIEMDIVQAPT